VKYWEIIADNLKKAGWSLVWVSAIDSHWRTIWIADAHRDGKRFIVRADEKLDCVCGTRIGRCSLAANFLDKLVRFFQTRRRYSDLNQAEALSPRQGSSPLPDLQSQNECSGDKEKKNHGLWTTPSKN
jgi:hypothetical protein